MHISLVTKCTPLIRNVKLSKNKDIIKLVDLTKSKKFNSYKYMYKNLNK